jgi:tetratricopeptide (TPR) repeat protein
MYPAGFSALRTALVCLVLFFGTLALFSRAVDYGFTNYDDPSYVTNNPHVQGGLSWAGLRWAGLRWAFTGRTDYWHPLTWLSHMLDWQLYGGHAPGHRLTSLLWHAVNAVLVFLLARRLTGAFWTSALCAALFAWHPLRVESVVWIPERKDVMSGFFFLLTLWAYAGYAEKRAAGKSAGARYGFALAAFAGGLMCKPVLVALPGVLLLLDFWPLRRWAFAGGVRPAPDAPGPAQSGASLLLEKVPFFLLSALIAAVTVAMQSEVGAFTLNLSLGDRLANAVVSIPRYLGKFFWPFDLTVCYPHPGHWPAAVVAAAAALVLAVTGVTLGQWRVRPWLAAGWGWFLVMLLPGLGIVQAGFQAMADRYTYIPMLGLLLALLWTLREVAPPPAARWLRAAVVAVVLAGCASRTWDQEATWRDPPTLFTHAIAVARDNYPAHAFLALVLLSENRVNEAEFHAQRAVAIKPDFAATQNALAVVRRTQGRIDEAMAGFRRVLELFPRSFATHSDLGLLLLQQDRLDEAAAHFQAALQIRADVAPAYAGLALVEARRGHPQTAVGYCEHALALMPRDAELHETLAVLLAVLGRYDEAARHFQEAIRLAPQSAPAHLPFARMLRETGRPAAAVEQSRQAVALQPDDPAAYVELARGLEQAGRTDEAFANFQHAAKLRPGDVEALCGMGDILLQRQQPEQARGQFEAALRSQPGSSLAYLGLALAADQVGQPDEMLANLQRALSANPANAALHRMVGDALGRREQIAEAAAQYQEALRLQPNDAETHARLGYTMLLLRRPAEAVQQWEEALRLKPDLPDLRARIEQARREMAGGPATGAK